MLVPENEKINRDSHALTQVAEGDRLRGRRKARKKPRKNCWCHGRHLRPRTGGITGGTLMLRIRWAAATAVLLGMGLLASFAASEDAPPKRPLRVDPQPIASDKSIRYDYDV